MDEINKRIKGYNTSIITSIVNPKAVDHINILIKKINTLDNNYKSTVEKFEYIRKYKYNIYIYSILSEEIFNLVNHDNNLSKTYFQELFNEEKEFKKELSSLKKIKWDFSNDDYSDITIEKINKIFINSFILNEDMIDITTYSSNRTTLKNIIIDEYVHYMNIAISKNYELVKKLRENNIELLFNCQEKIDERIYNINNAIQTYNFIPIKYSEKINELFGMANGLSIESIVKALTKKYNMNISIILDNISGNDIEYKIPEGYLKNINVNTEFINQTKTLVYDYFKPIERDEYYRKTKIYSLNKDYSDSKFIIIRKCDSNKYSLLSNDMKTKNYIIDYEVIKNFINNSISNRIHCYYKNENLERSKIFDPEVIVELNYNISFVPETIKENDFIVFIKNYLDKHNDVEELEESIMKYFDKLLKKDKYMNYEMKPIIRYLINGSIRMIKRDVFNEKNMDKDKLKKIVLPYFDDGKFIDKLSMRYNIIYSNRKDKDIFIHKDD